MGQKKKSRGQANPIAAGVLFVIVIIAIAVISIVVEKLKPSETQADLYTYYGAETEGDDLLVFLDLEDYGIWGRKMDGDIYLELSFLQSIDDKFYWDDNEKVLIYTTPTEVIKASEGDEFFTVKTKTDTGYVIAREEEDQVYVNLQFAELYTNMTHTGYLDGDGPARVLLWTKEHDQTVAPSKKGGTVRTGASIKDDIVEKPENGDNLTILEESGDWYYVFTENGNLGYIKKKETDTQKTVEDTNSYDTPIYTSITGDEDICMVWHQVTNQTANSNLLSMMSGTKGINVISPTWFSLSDSKGNFTSLASTSYVEDAHNVLNCQVWALIDDFSRDENGNSYVSQVLPYTSKRENLINQLIIAAKTYGFDGINIDFELITQSIAEDYIQFLRELSVECRNEGIVLSVDNYVPMTYNLYYDRAEQGILADYVIIMGYDEHTSSSDSAGSVASLPFVKNGIIDTLSEVPAQKVINAIPFYTRVWTETPEEYAQDGDIIIEDAINGNYVLSSEAVSMTKALSLVEENGASKVWLEELGQYYVEYSSGNSTVRIWLEEETSVEEKMKLIAENDLAGVAGWKLGLEDSSVWSVISSYLN